MDVHSARAGDVVRVVVSGEIDMATVDKVRQPVLAAITAGGVEEVLLDMAGVTFCDSSGLEAFDSAYAVAVEHGVRFRLADLQPGVRRVLEIVGLLDALTAP